MDESFTVPDTTIISFRTVELESKGFMSIVDTGSDIVQTFSMIIHSPCQQLVHFFTSGFFWSVLFLIVSLFVNALFQALTDMYYIRWLSGHPEVPKNYTLLDLGNDYLPFIDIPYIPSYIMLFVLTFTFLRFFFTPYRVIIVKRFFLLQGVIFMLRSLSIFSTYLPSPVPCKANNTDSFFTYSFKIFFGERSCHDLMFCPHTAALFLCAMFWYHYDEKAPLWHIAVCDDISPAVNQIGYPLRFTLIKAIILVFTTAASVVFVMCRRHYTIDIYIAALIAVLLFKFYHHYILFCNTRDNWINAFVRWFEADAPDIPCLVDLSHRQ
ncbi:hypothetical protein EIN_176360 [Entamoeba invadens IP1]|uniref:hypothetical protein n=1 Tax=Entamoeba invadens IP1 TaxID=370355 RepID=UPI0002C3E730|nr:hypothetical protein EIN_176360 [Entamoeba invadens IP1]ELP93819.1 hypothetical protein EIN_176360 [Entamoeba invadens IP1]|eukprot:XP_004260590.1 hypothetical protein EIN_176360 [Entamoeba invadens IP1]